MEKETAIYLHHPLWKKHITNLIKLRDYMKMLPKDYSQFDMNEYAYSEFGASPPSAAKPECGTVCCLAGHGPAAGIRPYGEQKNDWELYIEEKFGCNYYGLNNQLYLYLFGTKWDSNIEDAIERLDVAIKYEGRVPLSIVSMHEERMIT